MSLNHFKSAVNVHSSVERRWEEYQFLKEDMFFIGDVMVQAILTDEITVESCGDRIITSYNGIYKCHRGVVYTIIAEGDDIRITAKREIGDAGEEELLFQSPKIGSVVSNLAYRCLYTSRYTSVSIP